LAGRLVCGSIGLVTLIYLVQHGDKERLAGDPGLTELGRGQAGATARWLQGAGLQALFSSPLRRARETAAASRRLPACLCSLMAACANG